MAIENSTHAAVIVRERFEALPPQILPGGVNALAWMSFPILHQNDAWLADVQALIDGIRHRTAATHCRIDLTSAVLLVLALLRGREHQNTMGPVKGLVEAEKTFSLGP